MVAISPPISTIRMELDRHSIGYVAPGLVDASVSGGFISIDPIILRGQSVRTSTKAAFVVVL